MNPKSSVQSENGISFSIAKNVMREYNGLGYSTKSVKFIKDLSGYTSVKSLKAKVKGTSGNWFVMGISYQYPDDTSYGCFSHKICTGKETEFETVELLAQSLIDLGIAKTDKTKSVRTSIKRCLDGKRNTYLGYTFRQ